MTELIVVGLVAFSAGFWLGKWLEGRWWMDNIDPKRKEWRL